MSSRDKLIALAKAGGISSLVVIALIAGIKWEECPPGGGGPIVNIDTPTSVTFKNMPVGEKVWAMIRVNNTRGFMSDPSGMCYWYNSGTRVYGWSDGDSLLSWWPPYEGNGASIRDLQSGVVGNVLGPKWALGSTQFALEFDGVDDRVNVGTLEPGGPPLRLEANIQVGAGLVPAVSGGGRIIDKSTSALNYWQLTLYQTRAQPDSFQIRFRVRTTAGMVTAITPTYCVKVGRWHKVVGVYNGKAAKVYVDGILRTSAPWTGALVAAPTVPVYIGWGGHGGQPFKGKIEDVKIGKRVSK